MKLVWTASKKPRAWGHEKHIKIYKNMIQQIFKNIIKYPDIITFNSKSLHKTDSFAMFCSQSRARVSPVAKSILYSKPGGHAAPLGTGCHSCVAENLGRSSNRIPLRACCGCSAKCLIKSALYKASSSVKLHHQASADPKRPWPS